MIKLITIVLFSTLSIGCVSQVVSFEQHIKSWTGQPITEYIKARNLGNVDRSGYEGTKRVTELENGNLLYEFPYQECPVFFEVDRIGIIVNITTEENKDCY